MSETGKIVVGKALVAVNDGEEIFCIKSPKELDSEEFAWAFETFSDACWRDQMEYSDIAPGIYLADFVVELSRSYCQDYGVWEYDSLDWFENFIKATQQDIEEWLND